MHRSEESSYAGCRAVECEAQRRQVIVKFWVKIQSTCHLGSTMGHEIQSTNLACVGGEMVPSSTSVSLMTLRDIFRIIHVLHNWKICCADKITSSAFGQCDVGTRRIQTPNNKTHRETWETSPAAILISMAGSTDAWLHVHNEQH